MSTYFQRATYRECVTDDFKVPNINIAWLDVTLNSRHTRTCYLKCSMTK